VEWGAINRVEDPGEFKAGADLARTNVITDMVRGL